MSAEDSEINSLKDALQCLLNNQFVTTATNTLNRREAELGIEKRQGESLNFRRLRLINRYSTRPPFTMKFLEQQISAMANGRQVKVIPVFGQYKVKVTMPAKDADLITEMQRTVQVYLPANILYQIGVAVEDNVYLKEFAMLKESKRYTRLGSWSLGNIKFAALVKEVTLID